MSDEHRNLVIGLCAALAKDCLDGAKNVKPGRAPLYIELAAIIDELGGDSRNEILH